MNGLPMDRSARDASQEADDEYDKTRSLLIVVHF
jgi:hypothetical protein